MALSAEEEWGHAAFAQAQQNLQAGVYPSYPGFWSGDHVVPRGDSAGVMGRRFDARSNESPMRLKPYRASNRGQAGPQALKRATALATVFVLLPLSQVELFAQAPWPTTAQYNATQYSQYGQSPYGYGQQYAPAQQPGYNTAQPGYGQQQPYAEQPYPSQPYAQPSPQSPYGQQAYPQQPLSQQQYPSQQQNDAPPYAYLDSTGPQQVPQGFTAEQLEQMLAPIALYPDTLVAQVLAAATYPAQVTAADQWRRSRATLRQSRLPPDGRAELGPKREGAHGISAGAGHDEPRPALDDRPGQRLLQPAAGRARDGAGAAAARAGRRNVAEHAAGAGD